MRGPSHRVTEPPSGPSSTYKCFHCTACLGEEGNPSASGSAFLQPDSPLPQSLRKSEAPGIWTTLGSDSAPWRQEGKGQEETSPGRKVPEGGLSGSPAETRGRVYSAGSGGGWEGPFYRLHLASWSVEEGRAESKGPGRSCSQGRGKRAEGAGQEM